MIEERTQPASPPSLAGGAARGLAERPEFQQKEATKYQRAPQRRLRRAAQTLDCWFGISAGLIGVIEERTSSNLRHHAQNPDVDNCGSTTRGPGFLAFGQSDGANIFSTAPPAWRVPQMAPLATEARPHGAIPLVSPPTCPCTPKHARTPTRVYNPDLGAMLPGTTSPSVLGYLQRTCGPVSFACTRMCTQTPPNPPTLTPEHESEHEAAAPSTHSHEHSGTMEGPPVCLSAHLISSHLVSSHPCIFACMHPCMHPCLHPCMQACVKKKLERTP